MRGGHGFDAFFLSVVLFRAVMRIHRLPDHSFVGLLSILLWRRVYFACPSAVLPIFSSTQTLWLASRPHLDFLKQAQPPRESRRERFQRRLVLSLSRDVHTPTQEPPF